ncbi:GlxA family transcriptional regulator [Sediminivirga luteola]|uniref:GlxA family transcriptional regulator n=1 Tax=Sediminivirga luteola TaxID=1774748 RepID=UPI001E47E4FF|nr:helix-turn-helix domain-containing protein [Sediminivirga luteola]
MPSSSSAQRPADRERPERREHLERFEHLERRARPARAQRPGRAQQSEHAGRPGSVHRRQRRPHRVVVLLLPPVIGFDATIPSLIFGSATDAAGQPLYEVRMCTTAEGPVSTSRGYGLLADAPLEALAEADTVVVPGTRLPAARERGELDDAARRAFALIPDTARVVSVCTGAFVLAAAGMLDGRRATTHWQYAAELQRLHPAIRVDANALFVDEGRVLTSAGLTAGIDLCLHMVRQDAGWEVANRVARYCVAPSWRDGSQAQYIELPQPASNGGTLAASRQWALGRLSTRVTVPEWAAAAHMSVRTFNRRFQAETGLSPAAWLSRQRVRRAQELLETTDLPVDAIAVRTGFGTGAALRKQFRAVAGTTPSDHRRRFGSAHDRTA